MAWHYTQFDQSYKTQFRYCWTICMLRIANKSQLSRCSFVEWNWFFNTFWRNFIKIVSNSIKHQPVLLKLCYHFCWVSDSKNLHFWLSYVENIKNVACPTHVFHKLMLTHTLWWRQKQGKPSDIVDKRKTTNYNFKFAEISLNIYFTTSEMLLILSINHQNISNGYYTMDFEAQTSNY